MMLSRRSLTIVILNSFQDPLPELAAGGSLEADVRPWILKQVQDDVGIYAP
jgi:hypothetical protein